MNDSSKTLKLKPASTPAAPHTERKRSGARARQAALREQERQQQQRLQTLKRQQVQTRSSTKPRKAWQTEHVHSAILGKSAALRQDDEIFPVFAPCPQGLEEALKAELDALGFQNVEQQRAGCRFTSNWQGIMYANLYSRLATRILVELAHGPVQTEDDILELAQATPWELWFGPQHTLRLDTSAIRSPMQSLQYCNLRAKDGICDRIRAKEGARPSIDTVRPDARVHLFLNATHATLYLDSSGESLFKRGWRLDKGEAPLRENLAAGLLALAGWTPEQPLLDPFCGSGTLLIEAASIASNIPAGLFRPFAFERLRAHNYKLWQDMKSEARQAINPQPDALIFGCDIKAEAIVAAQQNSRRARLPANLIQLQTANATRFIPPAAAGYIVTNPPYGERLDDDAALWQEWSAWLKKHYSGWSVNVISNNLELPAALRLKPRRRHPLFNGALDCRLFSFDMVAKDYTA